MRYALGLVVILSAGVALAQKRPPQTVEGFLESLYSEHEAALQHRLDGAWREVVAHGLADTAANKTRFLQAMFVYHLVRHDGVLGNVFLIREDDGRHPDVMLRDAFAALPQYRISYVSGWQGSAMRVARGEVYAYGRCDELEMEESAMLQRLFGLPARIAMLTNDHVVTEVAMEGGFLRLDASFLRCIAFARARIVDAPPEDGVYSVARTNRIALRDFHGQRPIDASGAKRVLAAFLELLNATEQPSVYCRLR
jgi:hypothetical protein